MSQKAEISPKRKPGRPRLVPDLEAVRKLAALDCTDPDMAGFLGVSLDTIQRWRKRDKGFQEAYAAGKASGNVSLRRHQFRAAENGNAAVLIWLGKQRLGQREPRDDAPQTDAAALLTLMQRVGAAIAAERAGKANGHDTDTALDTAGAAPEASRTLPE